MRDLGRTFNRIDSLRIELIYLPPEQKMFSTSPGCVILRMTVKSPKVNCIIRETFFAWNEQRKARAYYDGAISALS